MSLAQCGREKNGSFQPQNSSHPGHSDSVLIQEKENDRREEEVGGWGRDMKSQSLQAKGPGKCHPSSHKPAVLATPVFAVHGRETRHPAAGDQVSPSPTFSNVGHRAGSLFPGLLAS